MPLMAKTPCEAPFIGGAENARRAARKRNSISSNTSYNTSYKRRATPQLHPKSMRPYDRFFAALLSPSLESLIKSQIDEDKHRELMAYSCSLLNVPFLPAVPIRSELQQSMEKSPDVRSHHSLERACSFLTDASFATAESNVTSSSGTFDNARSYYLSKAPLILEASRYIIADALGRLSLQKCSVCSLTLQLLSVHEKYPRLKQEHSLCAPMILDFRIESIRNNEKDMSWSRPGSVLVLRRRPATKVPGTAEKRDEYIDLQSSLLACVAPFIQKKSESNDSSQLLRSSNLSLMIFRQDDFIMSNHIEKDKSNAQNGQIMYQATALTTLISQVRQMEACLRMTKVDFMPKLLGYKKSKHIRFNDSEDDIIEGYVSSEDDALVEKKAESEGSGTTSESESSQKSLLEKLPQLNPTQERAASCFLNSLPSSLILVQGPPGTGKSTFLVNVICRRLAKDPNTRLLVTAPTNKAVTVLAQRFLDAINAFESSTISYCNPVLVGVEDKLISTTFDSNGADCFSKDASPMSLQSIFVYTWLEPVKVEWLALSNEMENMKKTNCKPCDATLEALINGARRMHRKLSAAIPMASSESNRYAKKVMKKLEAAAAANMLDISTEDTISSLIHDSISHTRNVMSLLDAIDPNDAVSELLSTARVIFCTLSTAGASIFKHARQVDDLIVDEAAAATEAEICIPFHLRPKRMLAVGDPMQLPPTIMSRRAADLGLSKSLHDRLMNECDEEYFMLDHQYRMVPPISHFPCKQFYNGSVFDGENVTSNTYSRDVILSVPQPYLFIHVPGVEYKGRCGSYVNNEECAKILEIVENIWKKSKGRVSDWDSHDRLRIITFYQAQAALLKTLLAKRNFHKVLVATVDSSQGCEADTVIVSFTRSNNNKGVLRAAGFLSDDRRINVALTRGKHQLICVGNAVTLGSEGSEALKQLILDAKERGCITEKDAQL